MSGRVGLLVMLLVMAMGSTVVAQESSPEASPVLAPDDLTLTLPSSIGDYDLRIGTIAVDDYLGSDEARELWRDLLLPLGKEPSDVTMAYGYGSPSDPDDETLSGTGVAVIVLRVDGVMASDMLDDWLQLLASGDDAGRTLNTEWLEIEGRQVEFAQYETDDLNGGYLYPKGEVLFMFVVSGDGAPTAAEVMAGLP